MVAPKTPCTSTDEEDLYDASDCNDPVPSQIKHSQYKHTGLEIFKASPPLSLKECEGMLPDCSTRNLGDERFSKPDGTIDYDSLYELPEEEVAVSMEVHGSVITHLLSQVKIGMDLTKVALPTFILEPRSLLEMYADYFAHPDMFIKIAELETEKERMVQVVLWYLCSYHAGRKSSVAKKPYNPLLGEIFQCFWSLDDSDEDNNDKPLINDGPVPWCHGNQLTFIAEQVSHHPPVSAFYAEHFQNRISFSAYIWTKSRFLGLSIGVQNHGKGVVHIIDRDEEYTVTFPNGYGRSILTVPWVELGGTVKINCEKTGYKAVIEFMTKPFYGGKKHRITGEVYEPNEKQPFLSISGEWNGLMLAKWGSGEVEEFADVRKLSIIRKTVRPIGEQEYNESRNVWKEVTAGLRLKNVSRASDAKFQLEEQQRMESKDRKERGVPWLPERFLPGTEENNWEFIRPLSKRLKNCET